MATPTHPQAWLDHFPPLRALNDAAWRREMPHLHGVSLPAGSPVFRCGDSCQNYLFMLAGSVKVVSLNPDGREVVLYHVGQGETCILTTSCLLGGTDYPAHGVAVEDVRAVTMPRAVFDRLLTESDGFRQFVFGQIGDRMARLMARVQEFAFERTHVRLARKLLADGDGDGHVHQTHAALAVELGTAREVVSRLLKDFEHKGFVQLGRGGLRVLDAPALETLANPAL